MSRLKPTEQVKNTRRAGPASLAPVSSPLALLLRLAERFWPSRPANSSSAASSARSPRLVSLGIRKPLWYQRLGGRSSSSSRSSVASSVRPSSSSWARMSGVGPTRSRLRAWISWLRIWAEVVIPSPEQTAGEGGQRRVEAYQLQTLQLSLGCQQPIEAIPVGLPVSTGVDAMMQRHGQRLETLLLQE